MIENESYQMLTVPICSFQKKNGVLSFNLKQYNERLCIFDKFNNVVIDVETCHQYPCMSGMNMQCFFDIGEGKIEKYKRIACTEYAKTISNELNLKVLKKCKGIIILLSAGIKFPDGNEKLSNEVYLNLIKGNKSKKKVKKTK